MKRKLIISFFMIMICTGLMFLVKGLQEKAAAVPQTTVAETAEKVDKPSGSSGTAASEGADAAASVTAAASTANSGTAEKIQSAAAGSEAKPAADSGSETTGSAAPETAQKKAAANFTVYDSVSGACLTSLSLDIKEGDTVAAVTMKALDGNYRATGSGDSVYFAKIMGISEKSAGPMSGWCFYVNGQKPGLSAGSYSLKAGDTVEWKFLKDGTNN